MGRTYTAPRQHCAPGRRQAALGVDLGRVLGLGLALGLGLGPTSVAWAGPLFFAGRLDERGQFVAEGGAGRGGEPCFALRYSETRAELDDGGARLRIVETVAGPAQASPLATVLVLPLPPGTTAPQLGSLRAGSVELLTVPGARLLEGPAAAGLLEQLARTQEKPELLVFSGQPLFVVPRYLLPPEVELTLELTLPLVEDGGLRLLVSPGAHPEFGRGPAQRVGFVATVRSARALRTLFSPTHALSVERPGAHEARLRVTAEQVAAGQDLRLFVVADDDPLGLRLLTHRTPGEAAGYFLLLGHPGNEPGARPIPKDLVLALDVSGSMRGDKLEQARAAIEYCLDRLGPEDRFNLVTFGSEASSFAAELQPLTERTRRQAGAWVDELQAYGRTNIGDALSRALAGAPSPGRPRLLIFLTDGTPTAGELDPRKILSRVAQWNRSASRVFVLGLGHDVNAHLLDGLAEATGGSSEYVEPEEEIDVKVAALFDRLRSPVLDGVALELGGLDAEQLYPPRLPPLFAGHDLFLLGRYRGDGEHTLALTGTVGGQARRHELRAAFPAATAPAASRGAADHAFVASLWASRRLGDLLAAIRLHGETPQAVQEVVELSRRHGLVTEYTAYLDEGAELSDGQAASEASRRLREANVHQSGSWAVRQSVNEQALKGKTVTGASGNAYVDRRGKLQTATKVRQVAGRVFYKRQAGWVEQRAEAPAAAPAAAEGSGPARPTAAAPPRRVKLFSDEYFELLRRDPDFAAAQSLGGKVTLEVQGESVTVY